MSRRNFAVALLCMLAPCFTFVLVPHSEARVKADPCPIGNCPSDLLASNGYGGEVLFTTRDSLVRADRNRKVDVYASHSGRRIRLITHQAARTRRNDDGIQAVFRGRQGGLPKAVINTRISLKPADRDGRIANHAGTDIYRIEKGKVRMLTPPSRFSNRCGKGVCDYQAFDTRDQGRIIYLTTEARLTRKDTDDDLDFYVLENRMPKLISGGPRAGGSDSKDVYPYDLSDHFYAGKDFVYFATTEKLVPEDTDRYLDTYRYTSQGVELATGWPTSPASQSYELIFFSKQVPGRFYAELKSVWSDATSSTVTDTLYRVDPGEEPEEIFTTDKMPVTQDGRYEINGESPDGSTIYFTTGARLDPQDTDKTWDLYSLRDGDLELISIGPRGSTGPPESDNSNQFEHVSEDGDIYFVTDNRLSYQDRFFDQDLYVRSGNEVHLESVDLFGLDQYSDQYFTPGDISFFEDDDRIVINTQERWLPADQDNKSDLYVIGPGGRRLLTSGGDGKGYTNTAQLSDALRGDGYLIRTGARLVPEDGDDDFDIYYTDAQTGFRRLLSQGRLQITGGPPSESDGLGKPVRFTFKLQGAHPRFRCSIDGRRFKRCRSPIIYRHLHAKRHTFRVISMGRKGLGRKVVQAREFRVYDPPTASVTPLKVSKDGRSLLASQEVRTLRYHRENRLYRVGNDKMVRYGQADLLHAGDDLSRIVFSTRDQLVIEDEYFDSDVYTWEDGSTELFPGGHTGFEWPRSPIVSEDGRTLAFRTRGPFGSTDNDFAYDVYASGPGGVREVSAGTALNLDATPVMVSADGSVVLFKTYEALTPEDTDSKLSLYWNDRVTTRYVTSDFGQEFEGEFNSRLPVPVAMSADGSRLIFETYDNLIPISGGHRERVYLWTEGVFTNVSGDRDATVPIDQQTQYSFKRAVSPDAETFLLSSYENILPADTDNRTDIYRNRNGELELVGPPNSNGDIDFMASTPDLENVVVRTDSPLVPADRNGAADLYLLKGESGVELLTKGPAESTDYDPFAFFVNWVSKSGDQVAFTTTRSLSSDDRDKQRDLYLWSNGKLKLVSAFKGRGEKIRSLDYLVTGTDGGYFYFSTALPLTRGDRNRTVDIYRLKTDGSLRRMPAPPFP